MPRIAANLSMLFTEVSMVERPARAAAAGFEAVEVQFPYEVPVDRWRAALDEAGLALVLHNVPAGDWAAGERGLAALPGREAEFRASLAQALAWAVPLGVPRLNVLAGVLPPGVDASQALAVLRDNLRHAVPLAADAGVTLLLEPLNRRDVPGFVLGTVEEAVAVIEDIRSPHLKLQFDLYHAQRAGGEVLGRWRSHRGQVGHIQVADNPGRHEPGTGELAWGFIFAELDRDGWDGWVGAEYLPQARTEDGLGWIERFGAQRTVQR